jgi:hypothetical protein
VIPYLKKTHHKNRAGGLAQGVGPEFKPQHHQKKTKKKTKRKREKKGHNIFVLRIRISLCCLGWPQTPKLV